jgi:3-oxoacyl-[acyl-carrier protein] reductase
MNTNLKAVFFMCQNIAKHMLKNNVKGHILNIGSEMGARPACVTYGISKWGVHGLTKGYGKMLAARGIVVNGIAPGAITTDMMNWKEGDSIYRKSHANHRFGFPEEIAKLALFLVSESGNNIIGEVVSCDGGSSLY